jgi:formamidopyrimidine-DNA glycosylase
MKIMKLIIGLIITFYSINLCQAQKAKTVTPKIESKYIGNWSNDNPDLSYTSRGYIEITNNSITYYSGEFAEYLNYKIENDKILLFYNGMEGSLKWNSNKKEDAKPKCKAQIGYLTKEGESIVLHIQNDVCGRLPNGKHELGKHPEE